MPGTAAQKTPPDGYPKTITTQAKGAAGRTESAFLAGNPAENFLFFIFCANLSSIWRSGRREHRCDGRAGGLWSAISEAEKALATVKSKLDGSPLFIANSAMPLKTEIR